MLNCGLIFSGFMLCHFNNCKHFGRWVFLDVVYELPHEIRLIHHVIDGIDDDILIPAFIAHEAVQNDGKEL